MEIRNLNDFTDLIVAGSLNVYAYICSPWKELEGQKVVGAVYDDGTLLLAFGEVGREHSDILNGAAGSVVRKIGLSLDGISAVRGGGHIDNGEVVGGSYSLGNQLPKELVEIAEWYVANKEVMTF